MICSSALVDLGKALLSAEALIDMDAGIGDPTPKGSEALVEGARVGASIIVVAAFEEYLRKSVEEHFAQLTDKSLAIDFSKLPATLQVTSIFQSLASALQGPRHTEGTTRHSRLTAVARASQLVMDRIVDSSALAYSGSNPSSPKVKSLFKTLAIPNVFVEIRKDFMDVWGKPEAATFIPDKLNEIVRRRHATAHTALALGIARNDLKESVWFMTVICLALDACLKRHLVQLISKAT